jgi:hypothetical protein
MFFKIIKSVFLAFAIVPLFVFAEYSDELNKMDTSKLKVAEASLIVEMKERAGRVYEPASISRFAATEGKRLDDKQKLVESVSKLLAAKVALNERSKTRLDKPGYNELANVELTDIKVTSHTKYHFDYPSSLSGNLEKGGIVKLEIISDEINFPLVYRITFGEDEKIHIQGVEVKKSGKTKFTIKYNNSDYTVTAKVNVSLNGWN